MDRKTRDYMMGTFGTERHTKKMETSLESGGMEIILNNNHFPIPTPSSGNLNVTGKNIRKLLWECECWC